MKKAIGLIAGVFVLAAVIVGVADYTPVTVENSSGSALSAASVTATGAVQGSSLAIGSTGSFQIANTTQLVFIASGVTNVIDADITS